MRKSPSDRGAILVHVAFALLALMALASFMVDFGALFLARRQAQNAADAGALSGALARLHDDTASPPASTTSGPVFESVMASINGHQIFGVRPTPANIAIDWTCPDGSQDCVAVDVFRDGTHGSAQLPTFFLNLANRSGQGTRAHAVARVSAANGVQCIKPWIVPDRFTGPHWPGQAYEDGVDTYIDPTRENSTGYGREDLGAAITLRMDTTTPSFYQPLSLLGGFNPGFSGYLDSISTCTNATYVVTAPGEECWDEPRGTPEHPIMNCALEKPGNGSVAQFEDAVNGIINQDPGASVVGTGTSTRIINSCAPNCGCGAAGNCSNGAGGKISPRIVPILIGDPAGVFPGRNEFKVVNIFAFFLMPPVDGELKGILVSTEGLQVQGGGTVANSNAFYNVLTLIR